MMIIIPLITRVRLNTCVPYRIRYPIPAWLTRNSPMITPIRDIDIFSFMLDRIVSLFDGSIRYSSVCRFVAWNVLNIFILYSSVFISPLYIVIRVTIVFISKLITIIDLVFAPNHIISSGPRDTFGRLFIRFRNGSNIFFNIGIK